MSDNDSILYTGEIYSIQFSLNGTETVLKDSNVIISSTDQYVNNEPQAEGLYDTHLGVSDIRFECQTCFHNKKHCLGHEGNINLFYPIFNPLGFVDMIKWLKIICFMCFRPIIAESEYISLPKIDRLDHAVSLSKASSSGRKATISKRCHYCNNLHPTIKRKEKIDRLLIIAEYYTIDGHKIERTERLYPHLVEQILIPVLETDVLALGKPIESHPRNFVLRSIKVPPTTMRSDLRKIGGVKNISDDLTGMLSLIIKANNLLNGIALDKIDSKIDKQIFTLNNYYYDFVGLNDAGSEFQSILSRFKGKEGRFRGNMLGKRIWNVCRSTIAGDPSLQIDQLRIPLLFARTIQMKEILQDFNKERIMMYVNNGRKTYPGCSEFIKNGKRYNIDYINKHQLKNGDAIMRDIIDGDPINFNRQPSLIISNISTHRAVVNTDPNSLMLQMNVLVCPYYNADFDGDQMNMFVNTNIPARIETSYLSSVPNWLISHKTSRPSLGQIDDSIIGLFELSRDYVVFDKFHAMLIFQRSLYLPKFENRTYTGRELISHVFDETPITYTTTPDYYKENLDAYLHYNDNEKRLVINKGKMISGVLDKKSIGKDSLGGIYHIISNEYNNKKALNVMFNMQQMAINCMMMVGNTIGILDILMPDTTMKDIYNIESDIIKKSELLTEQLNMGLIVPPINKSVEQFFEDQQINTLKIFNDFDEPIMKAIDPESNNLFKLIISGSKGKLENMYNIVSANGQKLINGERVKQKFGYKRTMPYFPRFDQSPEARGYVSNSFLNGLTMPQFIVTAEMARFDLISKALNTSITGEQTRKSVKNLESMIINNLRMSIKEYNIIQMIYGDDYLDARKVEWVKIGNLKCSDAEFEKIYKGKIAEEWDNLLKLRAEYRRIFMQFENIGYTDLFGESRWLGVNLSRIITSYKKSADSLSAEQIYARVKKYCDDFPYIFINDIQRKLKTPINDYIQQSAWLVCLYIKLQLCTKIIEGITELQLQSIFDMITYRYSSALIAPGTAVGIIAAQSFCEPLMQQMLDSHRMAALGGSSKASIMHLKDVMKGRGNKSMILIVAKGSDNASYEDKNYVQAISNNIEMTNLRQFTRRCSIFFEQYKLIEHPQFIEENALIEQFEKMNPLLHPPNDLMKWCIRIELNKTHLFLKNMSIETIVLKLSTLFPEIFIVHTAENAPLLILRIYVRSRRFNLSVDSEIMIAYKNTLLDSTLRGIDNITNASAKKLLRTKIDSAGSASLYENAWCIETHGSNLAGVFQMSEINPYLSYTDDIEETARILGIEAARHKIMNGFHSIVDNMNVRHYMIYADEMTSMGDISQIEMKGLSTRETQNILLRVGYSSPKNTLQFAALNAQTDIINGATASFLVGTVPRYGTFYNRFHINTKFVKENYKSTITSYLDML
ncbi:MAG: hypothetical protein ACYCPT_03945 [Acidimicrobiales bacterium]